MSLNEQIAAFIRERGVTHCPIAFLEPSSAKPIASDAAAIRRYRQMQEDRKKRKPNVYSVSHARRFGQHWCTPARREFLNQAYPAGVSIPEIERTLEELGGPALPKTRSLFGYVTATLHLRRSA